MIELHIILWAGITGMYILYVNHFIGGFFGELKSFYVISYVRGFWKWKFGMVVEFIYVCGSDSLNVRVRFPFCYIEL